MKRAPYIVLGAGVAGLAAGWELGERAIIVEAEARPGGLVRTERRGDFWFDRVLHLLYFADAATRSRVTELLGADLAPCAPEAWVESRSGVTRYPFQMHLGTLPDDVVERCLRDLAACTFGPRGAPPASFEALLLATFGRAMCDELLLPYNRKVWKRDLATLAPSGFQWNITPPDFVQVVRGARGGRDFTAYNADGWYPRPPADAPVRGMEVLSRSLASRVPDLRLEHRVIAIDVADRVVHVDTARGALALPYERGVISTLPLPTTVGLCSDAPLRERCHALRHNRVRTVGLAYVGTRPSGRGHWRYYGDESLCFSRLVYLHEFDAALAPRHGYPVLAEIVEPAEHPAEPPASLIHRVVDDIARCGGVPEGAELVDAFVMDVAPAYVVFDETSREVVADARAFLEARDIHALGRYGRWEYSSMAQVMRDGFGLAAQLGAS